MARLVRDSRLESRTARNSLAVRKKPYWRSLEPGLALGYYRGKNGGTWVGRKRRSDGGYQTSRLGLADDKIDRDGENVLSYADAIATARDWWLAASSDSVTETEEANYTVSNALDDYIAFLKAKGSKGFRTTSGKIEASIRPTLGTKIVRELRTRQIIEFQADLATRPPISRSGKPLTRKKDSDKSANERMRARRATANRTMSVLKAALNLAFREGRVPSDDAWRRVSPFAKTDSARVRYLLPDQIRSLDRHLPADFRALFHGALVTGARYRELGAVRVSDVDVSNGTVLLRETKNGKPRYAYLTAEGCAVFARAVQEKQPYDLAFTRTGGRAWKPADQARPMREGCRRAGIVPAVSFHDLRHTYGALLAQRGVPMRVIAEALGHSDTRITEKHYAHISPSYVAAVIRKNLPVMQLADAAALAISKIKPADEH